MGLDGRDLSVVVGQNVGSPSQQLLHHSVPASALLGEGSLQIGRRFSLACAPRPPQVVRGCRHARRRAVVSEIIVASAVLFGDERECQRPAFVAQALGDFICSAHALNIDENAYESKRKAL